MDNLKVKTLIVGNVQTNCYIISNSNTKEAIVIDPGDASAKIEDYLNSNDLVCKAILLTHGHFDHILAAGELREKYHVKIYIHEDDAALVSDPQMNVSLYLTGNEFSLKPDILLKDKEQLSLAGQAIRVIHTPGHTGGGVCYFLKEQGILFSGDTLFRGSVGRADFPSGDEKKLIEGIKAKLMVLDESIKVYPGHGMSTTIGYEKMNNFYLNQDYDF